MGKLFKMFLLSILCISIAAIPLLGNAAEGNVTISYDAGVGAVKLSVSNYTNPGDGVIVHIVPTAQGVPSSSALPVISDMLLIGEDGNLEGTIKLPKDFQNGKYTVYAMASSFDKPITQTFLICLENSEATKSALSAVNNAKTKSEFKNVLNTRCYDLGIDKENEIDYDKISDVMFAIINAEGEVTFEEISKAANIARASVMISAGESIDEVMKKYAQAFGTTYAQYLDLEELVKDEFDALMSGLDYSDGFVAFDELVAVATVVGSDGYGSMRDYILDNADIFEIDTDGDYDDLSVNNKSKVFKNMYEDRKDFKVPEDVKKAFDQEVKVVKKAENSESSKGNGGSGSGGGSFGGKTSYTEPVVTAPTPEVPPVEIAPVPTPVYSDISNHFAKSYIEELSKKGVINGFEDGSFRPDDNVTRAQAAKIIALALGIDTNGDETFEDVSKDAWYASVVASLASKGIVKGNGNIFNPDSMITREDASVIIMRALQYLGKGYEGEYEFTDASDISDYAATSVGALASNGFLKGDGINFMPKNNITRGELAAIIGRITEGEV